MSNNKKNSFTNNDDWKGITFTIFKTIIFLGICFLVALFFEVINYPEIGKFIIYISVNIIGFIIVITAMNFSINNSGKPNKNRVSKNTNINIWIDELYGLKNCINEIVGDEIIESEKFIEGLEILKEKIFNYFSKDIIKIKLFKASIIAAGKDKSNMIFLTTVIGIITTMITIVLRENADKITNLLIGDISRNPYNVYNLIDNFTLVIMVILLILFVIRIVMQGETKYIFLESILDICIEEIEKENEIKSSVSIKSITILDEVIHIECK